MPYVHFSYHRAPAVGNKVLFERGGLVHRIHAVFHNATDGFRWMTPCMWGWASLRITGIAYVEGDARVTCLECLAEDE